MKALKAIGMVTLALVGGILMPFLIWVAAGVAVKPKVIAGVKTVGKVMLALAGGILMPILIWVALGVAIQQKMRARKTRTVAAPSLGQILQDTYAPPAKAKPILIVDDEEVMRVSLKDWLADGGYDVETVEAGEEALKAIEVKDYSVAIFDLRLPGKDGIQILKEARSRRPQLKGVIMTAYPSVRSAVEAMKEGAVDYLQKPIDMNELEQLIKGILGPVQLQIKPEAVPAGGVSAKATATKATK